MNNATPAQVQQQRRDNEETEIDLLALALVVLKRWKLILLVAVLGGAAAFAFTKLFIRPTYRSSFTAYINNNADNSREYVSSGDISVSRSLTSTYATIIRSTTNLDKALEDASLTQDYEKYDGEVSVNALNNTEIIEVAFVSKNPDFAHKVATALEDSSPAYVEGIVMGSSMRVITHAEYPKGRFSPSYSKSVILGVLLGALLVIAFVVLRYLLDKRVKSPEELQEKFGIVVIGTIHDLTAQDRSGKGYYSYGYEKGDSNG